MLLSQVDFSKYIEQLKKKFKIDYSTNIEFEKFVKEKLKIVNIRYFLSDIVRAENIINKKDVNYGINEYTEVELILKANVSENRDALLSWKDESSVKKYLENINEEKLNFFIQLEDVFQSHSGTFDDVMSINDCKDDISLDKIIKYIDELSLDDLKKLQKTINQKVKDY